MKTNVKAAILTELRKQERTPLGLLEVLNTQGVHQVDAQGMLAVLISTGEIRLTNERILKIGLIQ